MKLHIHLGNSYGKLLLALRAGPMDGTQIHDRIDNAHVAPLIRAGHVVEFNGMYRLTESGRAACPNRRNNSKDVRAEVARRRPKPQQVFGRPIVKLTSPPPDTLPACLAVTPKPTPQPAPSRHLEIKAKALAKHARRHQRKGQS